MTMIVFLVASDTACELTGASSDSMIIRACLARNNEVIGCAPHNSLHTIGSTVCARGWTQDHAIRRTDFELQLGEARLIWVLGLGIRSSFLDRMQMLRSLEQSSFVNTVDSFIFLHGKHAMAQTSLSHFHPYTVASDDPDLLYEHVAKGGDWILKPAAGSYGRSVFLLGGEEEANRRALLELGTSKGFFLLQRKVDTSREKRWLIVNNRVIGVYGKRLNDHRGNLHTGSTPFVCNPSKEEYTHVEEIASHLFSLGIRYAAIDVAHPYLLDVNLANPGWLSTYKQLTGEDLSSTVVAALMD